MKKTILLIAILTAAVMTAAAQRHVQAVAEEVAIEELRLEAKGGDVAISFALRVGMEAVGKTAVLQMIPVIEMDADEIRLPGIVIEGRGAALLRERRGVVYDVPDGSVFTTNGTTVDYAVAVPFDSLKVGSSLKLEIVAENCSSITTGNPIVLAEKFIGEGRIAIPPVYRTVPHSEGDLLSQKYTFVAPLSEFEEQSAADRDEFVADIRGNSLTVYFRAGATTIDPAYRDNAGSLEYIVDAIASLREAEQTGSSRISHIIVAGYSSPEGELAMNRDLAYRRAAALREYLAAKTGIDAGIIDIHNGGIDWAGLRFLVEKSELPEKAEVAAMIGNAPDMTDADEEVIYEKLRRLNGGMTYGRIFREVFPSLRVATYLRIYYENIAPE